MPVKSPFVLLSAAANGTGTTVDLGAAPGANQLNYQVSAPGTVTAATLTIQGSNDGTSFTPIASVSNARNASGTILGAAYRYYNAVLASYAGTGTVRCTVSAAYRKH